MGLHKQSDLAFALPRSLAGGLITAAMTVVGGGGGLMTSALG